MHSNDTGNKSVAHVKNTKFIPVERGREGVTKASKKNKRSGEQERLEEHSGLDQAQ